LLAAFLLIVISLRATHKNTSQDIRNNYSSTLIKIEMAVSEVALSNYENVGNLKLKISKRNLNIHVLSIFYQLELGLFGVQMFFV